MSRNKLIKEAIAEAKAVREAALENAKSMIIDAFTPQMKTKINKQLDETINESNDQPTGYDAEGTQKRIPGGEDMLTKGDGAAVYEDDDSFESNDVDEDVYEIALEDEEPEEEPEDSEEEEEEEVEEPPMAENVKAYIRAILGENKAYKKAIKQLQREFNEINLFNAKLIYANKVLRTPGLTKNQKYGIVEQFDKAGTIGEVKLIHKSLTEGVKIGSAANRKPKAHKSSAPVQSVRGNKNIVNEEFSRMQELSGLLKD